MPFKVLQKGEKEVKLEDDLEKLVEWMVNFVRSSEKIGKGFNTVITHPDDSQP